MTDYNLITIDEFKAYAPEVDLTQYDDPTISGMISQASKMSSDYLLYTPILESISAEVTDSHVTTEGDLIIYTQKLPIVSVSEVKIMKGTTEVGLGLTNSAGELRYNIDYAKRYIRYPYGEVSLEGDFLFTNFYSLRGNQFYTKTTYTAGWSFEELPVSIKQATSLFMRNILSRRMNTSGAKRITQGGITMEYWDRKDSKSDLEVDAYRLLQPYRRIGL